MSIEGRRTKRRYAHELYPNCEEFETRALEIEVPHLYARAIGFDVRGTGWFERLTKQSAKESADRTMRMLAEHQIALMADAMLQGLTGQEAWEWADSRVGESGEWIYERAVHYGVNPDLIKPYPCGPEPDHHDHYGPFKNGYRNVFRAPGPESGCEECTEPLIEGGS